MKSKIHTNIIIFCSFFFFCYSLSFSKSNTQVKKLHLPAYSSQFVKYYNKKNNFVILRPEYLKQAKTVNPQEKGIKIKGTTFGFNHFHDNDQYYEISRFEHKNYYYKLIAYNGIGEADTMLMNIQLNSYNKQDKLVDALILDSQYFYEDISSYSLFRINPDFNINIDTYITYYYNDQYEYGDSRGLIKNPKPEIYRKEKYKIIEGHFKLISSNKFSQF